MRREIKKEKIKGGNNEIRWEQKKNKMEIVRWAVREQKNKELNFYRIFFFPTRFKMER